MPNTDPDFTSLSAAQTAAANGDTLYICGSVTSYGNLTLTKRLTLIGAGYFLSENPFTQANTYSSQLDALTCNSGSAGTLISGLATGGVNIYVNNITLKRNYIRSASTCINLSETTSNITIVQNYFKQDYLSNTVNAAGNNQSLFIANNIFYGNSYNLQISATSFATIVNNVFHTGSVIINNTVFQNNIMRSGTFTSGVNNSVNNNIGNSTQFGTANGNQSNVSMATVFTLTGSTDAMYMLLSGSPALGAGLNGVDCGIYGGQTPMCFPGCRKGFPPSMVSPPPHPDLPCQL
jgi:hypothetical protein